MDILLYLLTLISVVSATRILNCDHESAKVDLDKIEITGCGPRKRACVFTRGKNASLKLPFTPPTMPEMCLASRREYPANKLTAVVHGIIAGIPVPFSLPQSDACEKSGLQCPLAADQPVVYTAQLPVKSAYPKLSLKVKWELKDENGHSVVCIEFPVMLR